MLYQLIFGLGILLLALLVIYEVIGKVSVPVVMFTGYCLAGFSIGTGLAGFMP